MLLQHSLPKASMRQTYKPDNFKYNHQFSFEFFIDFTPTFHPVILNIFSVFDSTYIFIPLNSSELCTKRHHIRQINLNFRSYTKRQHQTHRSGLASILLKKSPVWGNKELSNLFRTMSVSTLKYCVYDSTLNTPLQLFAGCSSNVSACMDRRRDH